MGRCTCWSQVANFYCYWLLAFIVWFSLGWMALWVLPLLWPAFKDVVHHCPRCLNVIARQSRIKLPTFRSEVMTVKVGSCAVVLARKYVMILAGLIFVIGTVFVLRSTVSLRAQAPGDSIPKGPASQLVWEDFIHHCGPRQSLRHRTSVTRAFEEKFRRRTFKWQGEVLQIREGFDVFVLRTKSVVMVRMYPQRFPRRDMPDIALLFGEERNREVSELNVGDWVSFEATMTSHGHRGDPEVMMMWHVAVAPKPSPLMSSPSLHAIEGGHGDDAEAVAEASDREAEADAEASRAAARLHDKAAHAAEASVRAADPAAVPPAKPDASGADVRKEDVSAAEAAIAAPPSAATKLDGSDHEKAGEKSSNKTIWS